MKIETVMRLESGEYGIVSAEVKREPAGSAYEYDIDELEVVCEDTGCVVDLNALEAEWAESRVVQAANESAEDDCYAAGEHARKLREERVH